jgi:hypothetical protein
MGRWRLSGLCLTVSRFDAPQFVDLLSEGGRQVACASDSQWFRHIHAKHECSAEREKPLDMAMDSEMIKLVAQHNSKVVVMKSMQPKKSCTAGKNDNAQVNKRKRRAHGKENAPDLDDDVQAIIAQHNREVKDKRTLYVPKQYSARDIRVWEVKTGKKWYALSTTQRIDANAEIAVMLKSAGGAAASAHKPELKKRRVFPPR